MHNSRNSLSISGNYKTFESASNRKHKIAIYTFFHSSTANHKFTLQAHCKMTLELPSLRSETLAYIQFTKRSTPSYISIS